MAVVFGLATLLRDVVPPVPAGWSAPAALVLVLVDTTGGLAGLLGTTLVLLAHQPALRRSTGYLGPHR